MDENINKKIHKIINSIKPFCAPLYFLARRDADATQIKNNGTVLFIDTDYGRFLITAYHVWDAYLTKKKENENLILAIGCGNARPTILLEGVRLVDGEPDHLDIAILTFENINLILEEEKKFFRTDSFPLAPPKKGDVVFSIGYPGEGRRPNQPEQGIFSAGILFVDFVTDITEYNIYSVDVNGERQGKMLKAGFEAIKDFGGVSGAPVYVNRKGRVELIGFMTQFTQGNKIAIISRADYINNRGMINR